MMLDNLRVKGVYMRKFFFNIRLIMEGLGEKI